MDCHVAVEFPLMIYFIMLELVYELTKTKQVHVWQILQLHNSSVSSVHLYITGDKCTGKQVFLILLKLCSDTAWHSTD